MNAIEEIIKQRERLPKPKKIGHGLDVLTNPKRKNNLPVDIRRYYSIDPNTESIVEDLQIIYTKLLPKKTQSLHKHLSYPEGVLFLSTQTIIYKKTNGTIIEEVVYGGDYIEFLPNTLHCIHNHSNQIAHHLVCKSPLQAIDRTEDLDHTYGRGINKLKLPKSLALTNCQIPHKIDITSLVQNQSVSIFSRKQAMLLVINGAISIPATMKTYKSCQAIYFTGQLRLTSHSNETNLVCIKKI